MCQFKSAIVLKNGDVLHNEFVETHYSEWVEGHKTGKFRARHVYAVSHFSSPKARWYIGEEKIRMSIFI